MRGAVGRGGARFVVPLGVGTALSLLGDSTLYTVLPLHAGEAGVSLAAAGVLLGVNRLVRLLTNGLAGHLFDRGPKRALFLASLLIGGASTLLVSLLRGFPGLLAARLLWGLAWSGIWVGGAGILLAVTGPGDRGRWLGVYQLWFFVGSALGSLLGGALTDLLGYRGAMAVNGAATLLGAGAVWLALPRLPGEGNDHGRARPREPAGPPQGGRGTGGGKPRGRPPRWGRGLYLAAAVEGLTRLVFTGFLVTALSLLTRDRLAPWFTLLGVATLSGVLNTLRTAASAGAAPLLGRLSDRLRDRWAVLAAALGCGAAGLWLLALRPPLLLLAGLLLCAVTVGGAPVLVRTLAGDLARPGSQGKAVGLLQTAGDIGGAAGPPLVLLLRPETDLDPLFRLSAAALACALAAVLLLRNRLEPVASR